MSIIYKPFPTFFNKPDNTASFSIGFKEHVEYTISPPLFNIFIDFIRMAN